MFLDDTLPPARRSRSIYAALVPFPIACFVLTLMSDLAYWATASSEWETMSVWLLTIGLIVASVAILGGLVDLVRSRRVRGLGQSPISVAGHAVAFGVSVVNVFVHSRDGYTAVVPQGLVLSLVTVLVLTVAMVTTTIGDRS